MLKVGGDHILSLQIRRPVARGIQMIEDSFMLILDCYNLKNIILTSIDSLHKGLDAFQNCLSKLPHRNFFEICLIRTKFGL